MEIILEKIKQIYPTLTKSQKNVANYIHKNYREIAFLSVTALAKEIGVSDTTIVRFCMEIGYQGYSDFRRSIKEKVFSEVSPVNKLERDHGYKISNDNSVYHKVFLNDIENLKKTLDNTINQENFASLITLLCSAKHVYTIGTRGSAPLAILLGYALKIIKKNVTFIVPGIGNMVDELAVITPADLVIAITFSRYSTETVKAIDYLKSKKVKVALITDTNLSMVKKKSDLVLNCAVDSNTYFDSYTSCMTLINAIVTSVAIQQKNEVKKSLLELENLYSYFDVFYSGNN